MFLNKFHRQKEVLSYIKLFLGCKIESLIEPVLVTGKGFKK